MSFWNDFKTLANYRISYHIQNIFINSWFSAKREMDGENTRRAIINNKDKIEKALYDNKFNKTRNWLSGSKTRPDKFRFLVVLQRREIALWIMPRLS